MEGYRIPDNFEGRGKEFLTPRMGGVQNSWPFDQRILYPPGPLNNECPLKSEMGASTVQYEAGCAVAMIMKYELILIIQPESKSTYVPKQAK